MFVYNDRLGVESIPNGDFENWDSNSYEYPQFYLYNSNAERISDKTAASNLFKTTDAYHGNYAVRLLTDQLNSRQNFGYFLNGSPNDGDPGTWAGGIPINETPSGIKGYFKYNVASGDTALIIVSFSKNGNNIGTYMLPLSGVHNSYTAFDFTFTPALTQTPDSMILGFASSWAMSEIAIPGSELFVDDISLKDVSAQPAELNGDFEFWSTHSIDTPQNWISQNNNPEGINKTNEAASGNFALKLKTYLGDNDGRPQARPCEVSNGKWNDNTHNWEGGIPFNGQDNILSFYYKYAPAQPTGKAEVWIMLKKQGQHVMYQNILLSASNTYKHILLPFNYNTMDSPDSIIIGARSNLWSDTLTSHVGSVLIIDGLNLKQGGSGPSTPVEPAIVSNGGFEVWDSFTYEYPEYYPFNSTVENVRKKMAPISLFKTSDAHDGLSAVRLVTSQSTDKNNFGFIMSGNPNNDNPQFWTGGIPINEKPTGLKGYYKYNVAAGDTALVIATFSKGGSNIGSYFFPLSGFHTAYTEFNMTFSPALTQTPDSMILGFASSWAMAQSGIPGSELLIDDISLTGVNAQPSKLNGNFESWSSSTLETPQSWYYQDENMDACKKTNDAAVGSSALELHTYLADNDGHPIARPGFISTGYWTNNNGEWAGGTPFTNAIDTLAFYYKYMPTLPNDSAMVSAQFKMEGESFWYNSLFLTATPTYKYAEIPIWISHFYLRSDTVIISIQSNLWSDSLTTHAGSVLTIDDIHFKSQNTPTSVVLAKKDTEAKIFPNPTNGRFNINLTDRSIEGLDIYNQSGQKVMALRKNQVQTNMEVDMTRYPRGIYLIRINDGSKTEVKKLILK